MCIRDSTSIISPHKSDIAVAYTIWNNSDTVKGAGRSLILALQEYFSFDRNIMRLVTLSPLKNLEFISPVVLGEFVLSS